MSFEDPIQSLFDQARQEKRDEREAKMLEIAEHALATAKEANRIASEDLASARASAASAREQARWAKWAAIAAVIALIISNKDSIFNAIAMLQLHLTKP